MRASLQTPFDRQTEEYATGWRSWQAQLRSLDRKVDGHNVYRVSTAVLRCHESPTFPGGLIASLSIPWGGSKGDDDLGGYHLVWPRDLAQTAGAFLACGAHDEVLRVMRYLRAVQEDDGSWPQNCWLDGTPYWHGIQLDECAFPMLLLDMAWREGAIALPVLPAYWPMVARAAGFVIRHGPRTGQDRWEENSGYTPFTLAVQVAALLAAAELAEVCEIDDVADFLRDTADAWNEQIEDWVYVTDTRLAREVGVSGYYVRIAPEVPGEARAELDGLVEVRNRFAGTSSFEADELVSTDALALVRFGLRAADDQRITDTVKVIDHVLRVGIAVRAGVAALQRRRLRRARRRRAVRRHRRRPGLAAAGRRARPLRTGCRPPRRGGEAAGGDGGGRQPRQAAARAGVGRRADPGVGTGTRQTERFGHASGLGARGAHQAAAVAGGRCGVRPAAAASAALSAREADASLPALACRTGGRRVCRPGGHCGSICPRQHWCIGAPMGGRPAATCRTRDTGLGIHTVDIPTARSGGWPVDRIHLARSRDRDVDRSGLRRGGDRSIGRRLAAWFASHATRGAVPRWRHGRMTRSCTE